MLPCSIHLFPSVLNSVGQGLSFVEAVEGDVKMDILIDQDFYWKLMTLNIICPQVL